MSDEHKKRETNVESEVLAAGRLIGGLLFPSLHEKHGARDAGHGHHAEPNAPVVPPPPPTNLNLDLTHARASAPPTEPAKAPAVIDAPVCPTCTGAGKLGAAGYEVTCPACSGSGQPKICLTCRGLGRLGASGHEVACPTCRGKGA